MAGGEPRKQKMEGGHGVNYRERGDSKFWKMGCDYKTIRSPELPPATI